MEIFNDIIIIYGLIYEIFEYQKNNNEHKNML